MNIDIAKKLIVKSVLVKMTENFKKYNIKEPIEASRMDCSFKIHTTNGICCGSAGDYILNLRGNLYVINEADFNFLFSAKEEVN